MFKTAAEKRAFRQKAALVAFKAMIAKAPFLSPATGASPSQAANQRIAIARGAKIYADLLVAEMEKE